MSVRTYDPRPQEIYPTALCSAGCKKPYHSICRLCNLAYCFEHLKLSPHACDTKREFIVLTHDEVVELFMGGEVQVVELKDKEINPNCYTNGNGAPDEKLGSSS